MNNDPIGIQAGKEVIQRFISNIRTMINFNIKNYQEHSGTRPDGVTQYTLMPDAIEKVLSECQVHTYANDTRLHNYELSYYDKVMIRLVFTTPDNEIHTYIFSYDPTLDEIQDMYPVTENT